VKHPVTLLDGRQVDSGSEEHRHECVARMVAARPTLAERREYLEVVERRRGVAAADRLRATMKQLWEARRPGAGGKAQP
jgi:hypothetical protein